jgi:hypothetical protein
MMAWAACTKVKGAAPVVLECCCNVLMVSKGANISLEHPAARALAMEFLTPLTQAASERGVDDNACDVVLIFRPFGLVTDKDACLLRCCGRNEGLLEHAPGIAMRQRQAKSKAIFKTDGRIFDRALNFFVFCMADVL